MAKKTEAWTVLEKVLDSEEMHNLDSDTLNIMVNECFKMGRFNQTIFHNFNTVKALKLKHKLDVTKTLSLGSTSQACYWKQSISLKKCVRIDW